MDTERRDAEAEKRNQFQLEIMRRFKSYHTTAKQTHDHEVVRISGRDLALTLNAICPPCPELVRAIEHLEQAVMWANAAIARPPSEG